MTNEEYNQLKEGDAFWAYEKYDRDKELNIYRYKDFGIWIADNWEDEISPRYLIIVEKIQKPTNK